MRTVTLGVSNREVPVIAIGCMRMDQIDSAAAHAFVKACLDAGAVFFDHADIHGDGRCEEIFANAIGMNAQYASQLSCSRNAALSKGGCLIFPKTTFSPLWTVHLHA